MSNILFTLPGRIQWLGDAPVGLNEYRGRKASSFSSFTNFSETEHCILNLMRAQTHTQTHTRVYTCIHTPQHGSCCPAVHLIAVGCTFAPFIPCSGGTLVCTALLLTWSTVLKKERKKEITSAQWAGCSLELCVLCVYVQFHFRVCVCVQWARTGSIRGCLLLLMGGYCAQS